MYNIVRTTTTTYTHTSPPPSPPHHHPPPPTHPHTHTWWRHEQLSAAATLARVTHHSFQMGTKNDASSCAGEGGRGQSLAGTWLPR